jgi:hypothetical protein
MRREETRPEKFEDFEQDNKREKSRNNGETNVGIELQPTID